MMDVRTWTALRGILSRQLRHGAGQHTSGVYNRIHWGVITYVATYRRRMRPKVLAKIDELAAGKPVVFLTSRAETRRWLEQMAAGRCPAGSQGS